MISRVFSIIFIMTLAACAQSDSEGPAAAAEGAAEDAMSTAQGAADGARDAADQAAPADVAALVAAADPEQGKRFYIFCQACHTLNEGGMNKVGPNLHGIVGADAAQVEGFVYSEALTDAGIKWDVATLDAWIKRPAGLVPGTTMVFAGINDPEQRAALIAYLQQAGGS
ncbi:MAG: cytochrome c family protein [Gammaproteobacteria bacterium]|nr:cytochrome c family protein [Gammaproteobacteria bacterium]NND55587.1 cytochrome c family protein [Gammaproteobacteria bacterium]